MKKTEQLPGARHKRQPDYITVLSADKKLAAIIDKQGAISLNKRKNIHLLLCYSIMSQQLNIKVATRIQERFLALFNITEPTAQEILELSFDKLKSIGLSASKTHYIHNVARFFSENIEAEKQLNALPNDEAIKFLTQIKGVGRWTAEMLLMFSLARTDIFPIDDYGIQQAMKKLYRLNDTNKKIFRQKAERIASLWHPYQTYACIYLWKWKDDK